MNLETANRLVDLRKQNGLSQEELAEKLGVSHQAVSKWETGESSPDTDSLIALVKLYNLSLDELLMINKEAQENTLKVEVKKENFKYSSYNSSTLCNNLSFIRTSLEIMASRLGFIFNNPYIL